MSLMKRAAGADRVAAVNAGGGLRKGIRVPVALVVVVQGVQVVGAADHPVAKPISAFYGYLICKKNGLRRARFL
jgi:hypothetical protein